MLENAFLGLYNLKCFCALKLLSYSGLYKFPSSNLGSVKSSVHHRYADITGPAGQWNKKLGSNPVYWYSLHIFKQAMCKIYAI